MAYAHEGPLASGPATYDPAMGRPHRDAFAKLASRVAWSAGRPWAFAIALGGVLAWAVVGPLVGFSDSWQLTINTTTTIVTFLMVFLIQNTQHRDGLAVQLKLDELLRATETAHNALLDLEELTPDDLRRIKQRYAELAALARAAVERGDTDTGPVEIRLADEL